jgi:mRNA-degrading endonuclease RelE of RelBE toxin-antitoxin system
LVCQVYHHHFLPPAQEDLKALRKFEQKEILEGIKTQLRSEPTVETRNRKRLEPNELAEWELRVGKFRIFYNVDKEVLMVYIEAVGVKEGNLLFIRGRRVEL